MDGQLSFATLDYAGKKKRTKRDVFLAEMAATVPWSVLEAVIAPHYPQQGPKGGRRAFPIAAVCAVSETGPYDCVPGTQFSPLRSTTHSFKPRDFPETAKKPANGGLLRLHFGLRGHLSGLKAIFGGLSLGRGIPFPRCRLILDEDRS